jgi:hypothetical protein
MWGTAEDDKEEDSWGLGWGGDDANGVEDNEWGFDMSQMSQGLTNLTGVNANDLLADVSHSSHAVQMPKLIDVIM